jgi:hypothetical protein
VAEIEKIPSTTPASATPNGQRRRHHSERQASAPQAKSTTICHGGYGAPPSCSDAPRAAPNPTASRNATTSTTQSRPVRGPIVSGSVASTGAGLDADTH